MHIDILAQDVIMILTNQTKAPWQFNRLYTLDVIYFSKQLTNSNNKLKGMKTMTDNELLLAISDIMDKKLESRLKPLENEIESIKYEQKRINIIIENEIRTDVKKLAENYLPAAIRYEKETAKIEAIEADIEVIKHVIREHSEKLQKLA